MLQIVNARWHNTLCVMYNTLRITYNSLSIINCTLSITHDILYIIHNTLYIIFHTLYIIHNTLNIIHQATMEYTQRACTALEGSFHLLPLEKLLREIEDKQRERLGCGRRKREEEGQKWKKRRRRNLLIISEPFWRIEKSLSDFIRTNESVR